MKPIIFVDKVGVLIESLEFDGGKIYERLLEIVESVNIIIISHFPVDGTDFHVSPRSIGFGSVDDQWGFSLRTFAKIYSMKFGIDLQKMVDKLWG